MGILKTCPLFFEGFIARNKETVDKILANKDLNFDLLDLKAFMKLIGSNNVYKAKALKDSVRFLVAQKINK